MSFLSQTMKIMILNHRKKPLDTEVKREQRRARERREELRKEVIRVNQEAQHNRREDGP